MCNDCVIDSAPRTYDDVRFCWFSEDTDIRQEAERFATKTILAARSICARLSERSNSYTKSAENSLSDHSRIEASRSKTAGGDDTAGQLTGVALERDKSNSLVIPRRTHRHTKTAGEDILSTISSPEMSDYKYLKTWLIDRTCNPIRELPFVIYCVLAIIGFAGLGIWVEAFKYATTPGTPLLSGVVAAVLTYFPTLAGPAALQLVLASASKNDKIVMSFALLILCVLAAVALVLPHFSIDHPYRVLAGGALCSLCAVWVWWITNGDDETYKKKPPEDAATGGDTGRSLPGTLEGYEV